jgi:hypothetical protein
LTKSPKNAILYLGNQNKMSEVALHELQPMQASTPENIPGIEQLYAANVLHTQEVVDAEGFTRPIYEIAGKHILFRSRQETPRIEGSTYTLVEGPGQEPLPVEFDENFVPNKEKNEAKQAEFSQYVSESSNSPESILVSANTPEGILETAALLNPEKASEYTNLATEMANGTYRPEAIQLLDTVTACLYINDEGELGTVLPDGVRGLDIDAYALVTAAIAGDEKANQVVESRVEHFKRIFAEQRLGSITLSSTTYDEWIERRGGEPEQIKAENIALVHSTAHVIERNENGEVVLQPSSQKRADKFPRATIHFTPNSQVTDHYAGSWDSKNRLIVGNMQKMIDANGNPSAMDSVDTYFSVNPGEVLVIPGASVIEGSSETDSLITANDSLVTYKARADSDYSETDRHEIEQLAVRYGVRHNPEYNHYADTLREVALRQTMEQKGVDPAMMATAGAHYSDNQSFNDSFGRLRREIGVLSGGLHIYNTDSKIEKMARESIIGIDRNIRIDEGFGYDNHLSLPALRQVTASGYWPARRPKPKQNEWPDAPMM